MKFITNKFLLSFFVLIAFLFIAPSLKNINAQETENNQTEETLEGKVTKVLERSLVVDQGFTNLYQKLEIKVSNGSLGGRSIVVENGAFVAANAREYNVGEEVVISYSKDIDGSDLFMIVDYVRRGGLAILALLFVALTVFIGGIWGASSLVGMVFSFIIIFAFILPQIINGNDAVTVAIMGSAMIIPVTFGLSHGLRRKTFIALAATIITLVITALLAVYFVGLTHLTGFSAEEAGFLQFELGSKVNMRGILLAGIIIASLGILDDITISQASIVEEIRKANDKLKPHEVFMRAMRVGRDHIASLVNTLILVYTGASLPLLLLFMNNPHPISEVINYEIVAEEIVRTLVGSMGLILAVPITTFLAAYWVKKDFKLSTK